MAQNKQKKVDKKSNNISGRNIYLDRQGQTVYYDPISKCGYIIDKKVERQYVEITDMSLKQSKTSKKTKTTATVKKSSKKMSYIEINIGEIDKIRPNQLVVFLHDELKIHREHFGKIIIKKKY